MTAQLLDGKAAASAWEAELAARLKAFPSKPKLVLVRVGDDPASGIYVKRKVEACARLGLESEVKHLPAVSTQDEVLALVEKLNADKAVHGILVQVPLPKAIDPLAVQRAIHPFKDVDGFGPKSMGLLLMGIPRFAAATPAGIMRLLAHHKLDVAGMRCVVVGRSNIVGKPLAQLLLMADATVTIAHSKTPDLGVLTREADFLFVAVGKPYLISKGMVRPGAVVVDVGMNRLETPAGAHAKAAPGAHPASASGSPAPTHAPLSNPKPELEADPAHPRSKSPSIVGDVDFEEVKSVASWITPVPGGVGPMTIASLLANTVKAYEMGHTKE